MADFLAIDNEVAVKISEITSFRLEAIGEEENRAVIFTTADGKLFSIFYKVSVKLDTISDALAIAEGVSGHMVYLEKIIEKFDI